MALLEKDRHGQNLTDAQEIFGRAHHVGDDQGIATRAVFI
jgi:hypothetical protein